MTGQNKESGDVEEMAVSSFCYHVGLIHPISFSFLHSLLLCVYVCVWGCVRLIFTCCLGEDKMMRLYNGERESCGERKEGDLSGKCSLWKISRPASSNWYILDSGHSTFISLVL